MFVLTDLPVGYISRYTLHIKTNSKTGKTVLMRTDYYIFKQRRKYSCYMKKLLTPDLTKYNSCHLEYTIQAFYFIFGGLQPYMIVTQGE